MADLSETERAPEVGTPGVGPVEQRRAKQAGLAEAVKQELSPENVLAMSFEAVARLAGVKIPADAKDGSITDWSAYGIRPRLARLYIANELQAIADAPRRRLEQITELVRPAMADMELPVEMQRDGNILIRMADRVEGRGIEGYKAPRTCPQGTQPETREVG